MCVGYMSNREEPVFAMLGAVSIGAIWTGALPLLGSQVSVVVKIKLSNNIYKKKVVIFSMRKFYFLN